MRYKLLFAAAILLSAIAPSQAETYKFLGSWSPAQEPGLQLVVDEFLPSISEAITDADVELFGPETVPPFEQLEPVRSGVFDFLYTNTAYHFGDTRVGFFAEAINASTAQRREAGIWDQYDKNYNALGLKLIAMITTRGAYQIVLREEPADGTLKGLKVRGTPNYAGVIEKLGASLVVLPFGETYTALERGVVDGGTLPVVATRAVSWHKVAPYMLRPTFGNGTNLIFMNLDKFNALSGQDQTKLLDAAKAFEDKADAFTRELVAKEQAALEADGGKNVEMNAELSAQINTIWSESLFSQASETDPEAAEALRNLADQAGFLK